MQVYSESCVSEFISSGQSTRGHATKTKTSNQPSSPKKQQRRASNQESTVPSNVNVPVNPDEPVFCPKCQSSCSIVDGNFLCDDCGHSFPFGGSTSAPVNPGNSTNPESQTPERPKLKPLSVLFKTAKERIVAAAILKQKPDASEGFLKNAVETVFNHGPVGGKNDCADCRRTPQGAKCDEHRLKCKCKARFDSRSDFRFHLNLMGHVSSSLSARRIRVFTGFEAVPGTDSKYNFPDRAVE